MVTVEEVGFYSGGTRIAGRLHLPDNGTSDRRPPIVVTPPGWMEVMCSNVGEPFHEGFARAGYAVLTFDFRGWGATGGEPGWVRPGAQLEDMLAAIAYAKTRSDLNTDQLATYGLGGTGGGLAIAAAAADPSVRAVAVQTVVADGRTWLRRMRREYEWHAFCERVEKNRLRRALTNEDEFVDPTEELMVGTPERRAAGMPTRGSEFHLSSAEELMRFRPIDVVDQIAPRALLLTCIENDPVTPEEHARALFERAGAPKKLVRQRNVSHYTAYQKNYERLMAQFVGWFNTYARFEDFEEVEERPAPIRPIALVEEMS
ncbi:MAG TPA: alpha/beta fold hydrolase [Candidatus Saccharimonadales bacterium]|nr:alpha/beta fold hydrolase [Candidatus Saccharimonadales bacterium]